MEFKLYYLVDEDSRKTASFASWFCVFLGFFAGSLVVAIAYQPIGIPPEALITTGGFFLFGLFCFIFPFLCGYRSYFCLRQGRFELHAIYRKRAACRKEDVVSFGQVSSGSVGLFAKDGALLLLIPYSKGWDTKSNFIFKFRHVLIHQGLVEIPQEEADKLYQAAAPVGKK